MNNITWLRSQHINTTMKTIYKRKLQYQQYEYSIYYGHRRFEKNASNMDMNHWILASLDLTNKNICHVFSTIQKLLMKKCFVKIHNYK